MPARLIVLSGPSHSGKSTVAGRLLDALPAPAAHLAIDDVVATFRLDAAGEAFWARALPAAYDVVAAGAAALLRRGFTVIVESTFTFVPLGGGTPQTHLDQLERLAALAVELSLPFDLVRLHVDEEELMRRRAATGRLWDEVVRGSFACHEAWPGPAGVVVDAGEEPDAVVRRVLGAVGYAAATR